MYEGRSSVWLRARRMVLPSPPPAAAPPLPELSPLPPHAASSSVAAVAPAMRSVFLRCLMLCIVLPGDHVVRARERALGHGCAPGGVAHAPDGSRGGLSDAGYRCRGLAPFTHQPLSEQNWLPPVAARDRPVTSTRCRGPAKRGTKVPRSDVRKRRSAPRGDPRRNRCRC